MDEKVFSYLQSLKVLHLEGNQMNTLQAGIFNLTKTINITKETIKENIHCNFYKKPLTECIGPHIPKCVEALSLKDEELAKFEIQGCAHAQCDVKETGKTIKCYMASSNANETSWSILGDNSAVKLALWTFGLLAVTSNFLVLLTLACNRDARKSALCVFVMNLLLGNILIGIQIVIFSVSDTLTYGNFKQYGEGRWEMQWCLPLFFIKSIGLILVVCSLVLVSIERILVIFLNSPRHIDCCRSIGYVMESWLFAGVAAIVLWTKTGSWGYLCSTHANSKDFIDINKGIKISLFAVCFLLIILYICLLCRVKRKNHENQEYRTTMRMFILILSTFIFWGLPYMVMVLVVPRFLTVTVSMQTLAISLTINACLHPFIYSYDNDNLENLYSTLACKRDSCLFVPLAVQGQTCYKEDEEKAKQELDVELGSLPRKRSLESLSVPEQHSSCPYSTEACARLSAIPNTADMIAVRGAEVSKTEGAVIIRNKSPTGSNFQEDCSILVHSAPSSPVASTGATQPFIIDEHSECGTLSSDTNVTWISSDCPSHAHVRIGDGNSTTSSRASSIPLGKSAASPRVPRKRLSSVKSDSEKSDDDDTLGRKSPPASIPIPILEEENKNDVKQEPEAGAKSSRPMSPVEMLFKVLSPKLRKKRPKTDEGLPGDAKSTGVSRGKRSKSMVIGKEAKSTQVSENVLEPLPPVVLRDRKTSQARDKRNAVVVMETAEKGLELKRPLSPSEEKDTKSKAGSFSVGKPVNSKSMLKLSNKDKKKRKINSSLSEPVPKVRIYENPVADFENNNQTTERRDVMSGDDSVPTSPTRILAKLEEGDTVPELPKGIKPKCRNSTSSTSSSLRLSSKSLEWDPSYVDETYSDALLPSPTAPPQEAQTSNTPSSSPRSSYSGDQVESNLKSYPASSRFSLDWDPTSVQMRNSVISQESSADSSSDPNSEPTVV